MLTLYFNYHLFFNSNLFFMKKLFFLPLIPVLFACCGGDNNSAIADGFVGAFVDSTGRCSTKRLVTISKTSGSTLSVSYREECSTYSSTVEGNVANSALTLKSGYFGSNGYKITRGVLSLSNNNKTLAGSIDLLEAGYGSSGYDTTRTTTETVAFTGKRL